MSVPEDVTITGDEWMDYPPHDDWRINMTVSLLRQHCDDLKHVSDRIAELISYAKRIIRLMPAATTEVQKAKDLRHLEECRENIQYYTRRQGERIASILELLPGLNHTYLHNPPSEVHDA